MKLDFLAVGVIKSKGENQDGAGMAVVGSNMTLNFEKGCGTSRYMHPMLNNCGYLRVKQKFCFLSMCVCMYLHTHEHYYFELPLSY